MKKKTLIAKLFAFALGSMLAFSACSFLPEKEPVEEVEEEEEEEELLEIELSDKKVSIEVGEEVEVEIENFDDLKKVKIEVEDEDIAEAELDDEIITITGLSEGKTTLTVTAKDSEEVTLTIKVTEPEIVVPEVTVDGGKYVCTFPIPDSVWEESMGEDAEFFIDFMSGKTFTIDFIMTLNDDGTAVLTYSYDNFIDEFLDYLDENFLEFMKLVLADTGETFDEEFDEIILDMKDDMLEAFREEIELSMEDVESESVDLSWEIKDDKIIITAEYSEPVTGYILDDGSFTITLSAEDLETDMFGHSVDLHFVKE